MHQFGVVEMKPSRVVIKPKSGYVAPVEGLGDGGYGIAIQNMYDDAGIETNYGPGNDMESMSLDVKTCDPTKKGHITVESCTINNIIKTEGACFLNKLQKWNFHLHHSGVLKDVIKVDFRPIQDDIKKELKELTEILKKGKSTAIWALADTENFMLERKGKKSATLRIKFSKVFKMITKSKSVDHFNELFGDDE